MVVTEQVQYQSITMYFTVPSSPPVANKLSSNGENCQSDTGAAWALNTRAFLAHVLPGLSKGSNPIEPPSTTIKVYFNGTEEVQQRGNNLLPDHFTAIQVLLTWTRLALSDDDDVPMGRSAYHSFPKSLNQRKTVDNEQRRAGRYIPPFCLFFQLHFDTYSPVATFCSFRDRKICLCPIDASLKMVPWYYNDWTCQDMILIACVLKKFAKGGGCRERK